MVLTQAGGICSGTNVRLYLTDFVHYSYQAAECENHSTKASSWEPIAKQKSRAPTPTGSSLLEKCRATLLTICCTHHDDLIIRVFCPSPDPCRIRQLFVAAGGDDGVSPDLLLPSNWPLLTAELLLSFHFGLPPVWQYQCTQSSQMHLISRHVCYHTFLRGYCRIGLL